MTRKELKRIIKEIIVEISSEEWYKVGQRPPKSVNAYGDNKRTYDEPTFGER